METITKWTLVITLITLILVMVIIIAGVERKILLGITSLETLKKKYNFLPEKLKPLFFKHILTTSTLKSILDQSAKSQSINIFQPDNSAKKLIDGTIIKEIYEIPSEKTHIFCTDIFYPKRAFEHKKFQLKKEIHWADVLHKIMQ